jgi:hypothetical protein
MQKKSPKRLILNKITIANLSPSELGQVQGGLPRETVSGCAMQCCQTQGGASCGNQCA